jgi:CRISPR-associated protein Cas2
MTNRDLYIAAYDIASPKRLRTALKVVRGHATGGQKSAYECFLTPAERADLLHRLREVIDPLEDRVLLIRLDPRSRVHTLGIAVAPQDPPFFYCG